MLWEQYQLPSLQGNVPHLGPLYLVMYLEGYNCVQDCIAVYMREVSFWYLQV